MSFPRYPQYKPSGVEWLGDVPEHWGVVSVGQRYQIRVGKMLDSAKIVGTHLKPYLRVADVQWEGINTDDLPEMDFDLQSLEKFRLVEGDLIVNEGGSYVGRSAIWRSQIEECYYQKALHRLRPLAEGQELSEFFYYVMVFATHFGVFVAGGNHNTIEHLPAESLRKYRFTFPPKAEQHAIVSFLDRETGKIDELVAEQRRLMELLKEKRQAVISHAVTKGLNPHAPLKPSGIQWLGDVPEHWSVAAVRFRYTVQLGKMLDTEKITGKHLQPYLRVFDVQWGEINVEDLPQMDFDPSIRDRFRLTPGDLLINEGGSYPGRSAIWKGELQECYFQKALHRLRPCDATTDTTRFFFYIMAWATALGVFTAGGNESTIEHLPAEKFRKYRFAFPPILEQLAIADFLDEELDRFDALTAEALRGIELLQERRTALISAAVTGKIKVL